MVLSYLSSITKPGATQITTGAAFDTSVHSFAVSFASLRPENVLLDIDGHVRPKIVQKKLQFHEMSFKYYILKQE